MTPCEKMGYKVGDKFEVVFCRSGFSSGQIVELFEDDGSIAPLFKGENSKYKHADGMCGAYVNIEYVRPVSRAPLTQQLADAVKKRDKYSRKADKWAQRFADQAAEVSRIAGELEKEIEEATGMPCRIGERFGAGVVGECGGPEITKELITGRIYTTPADVAPCDPKTWREGDVVVCVCLNGCSWAPKYLTEGVEYKFCEYDPDNILPFLVVDDDGDKLWTNAKPRFVRRPGEQ